METKKKKSFEYPSWLKGLNNPTTEFDQSPPTYAELTKTIKKMKSGASPRPLDQISIIAFQKCPALRSQLLSITAGGIKFYLLAGETQ